MPKETKTNYIFVLGGVMSGIGKGIATSSIAKIIQARGFEVTAIKIDPYVNVDAGTMNPTEHGEVFVLASGLETDQDMGNYERFLNVTLPRENYMTTGSVYQEVIQRERDLEYQGKCVQIIPHVTNEIVRKIETVAKINQADFVTIEVGGTTGDYENDLFTEAARQMKMLHPDNVVFVLISYVPYPKKIGEMKTKPTQQTVRALNSAGIQPDFIIARAETLLDEKRKEKIAFLCNVPKENVLSSPDIDSVYEVPLNFDREDLSDKILAKLNLTSEKNDLSQWKDLVEKIKQSTEEIKIGIVGKYFGTGDCILSDAYISVIEAIKHACYSQGRKAEIDWINSEVFEKDEKELEKLKSYAGIIVPGGFGARGVEGKIKAIEYVRKNKIPYLGLCYGMQLMVIEYARNVLGLKDAHTTEIDEKTQNPVIDLMPEQKENMQEKHFGATMRLGDYKCLVKEGSLAFQAYQKKEIAERHRHRFEVNPLFIAELEKQGLVFSGKSPDGKLMEIAELKNSDHPFMLGSQFHPEFTSTPLYSQPLFLEFIKVSIRQEKK